MWMIVFVAFLFSIGCATPNPEVEFLISIRPISDVKIDTKKAMRVAQIFYEQIGLEINILPLKIVKSPSTFSPMTAVFFESRSAAAALKKEVWVWFVDQIVVGTWQPTSAQGLSYAHTVVITKKNHPVTLAHELGHYFGLKHTWSDSLSDTPWKKDDVSRRCLANLMSYGRNYPNQHSFTPQQVNKARTSFVNLPRIMVVSKLQ